MQSSSAQVTMMESQNRKRAPAWTEREVRDLIAVWGEESVLSELRSSFRNAKTFVKISQGMKDRGHNRDPKQCHVKLKELRQAYQKTREANSRSGSEPQTCRFYDELHAILGGSATTTPAVLFDSFNGDGGNTEAGFGDEEDDDEEEVVASSQQASGETGFPDSQELFLTLDLEPVPPEPTQGCLLDSAGGEGTSAACVSMITGSSPSQRLVKLRKKKKRTRDEMFSELMLSSHTDRAQTNAWRQIMSECRKAQNDREERWWAEESKWRAEESNKGMSTLRNKVEFIEVGFLEIGFIYSSVCVPTENALSALSALTRRSASTVPRLESIPEHCTVGSYPTVPAVSTAHCNSGLRSQCLMGLKHCRGWFWVRIVRPPFPPSLRESKGRQSFRAFFPELSVQTPYHGKHGARSGNRHPMSPRCWQTWYGFAAQ
nr:uncharacterized protein LOC125632502 [Caretta caretta]